MENCVSRDAFDEFCARQYAPNVPSKTMRREKRDKIVRYLNGLERAQVGSWRYRIEDKGYSVQSFPDLGLNDVLCLKGSPTNGSIEKGVYGEWRRVLCVEEFYDVLLKTHVQEQRHGGYKNLLKMVQVSHAGIPREAATKFVSLCSVCQNNPLQRLKTAKATEANRRKISNVPCFTHEFNMRCQIDLIDMTQNLDGSYTHIGLYTDHWTKFITLFPMFGCSANHISYGLISSVFPYFGPPRFLHSPEGKDFATEVIRLSMETWKGGDKVEEPKAKAGLLKLGEVVEATRDNLIELINARALEERIQGIIPWASWLGKMMFDLNNRPNEETGKSAYSRVFERSLGLPHSDEPTEPLKDFIVNAPKAAGNGMASRLEAVLPTQQQRINLLVSDDKNVSGMPQTESCPAGVSQVVIPQEMVPPHIVLQEEADAVLPVGASEIFIDNPVLEQAHTFTPTDQTPTQMGQTQSQTQALIPLGQTQTQTLIPIGQTQTQTLIPIGQTQTQTLIPIGQTQTQTFISLGQTQSQIKTFIPLGQTQSQTQTLIPLGQTRGQTVTLIPMGQPRSQAQTLIPMGQTQSQALIPVDPTQRQTVTTMLVDPSGTLQNFVISVDPAER